MLETGRLARPLPLLPLRRRARGSGGSEDGQRVEDLRVRHARDLVAAIGEVLHAPVTYLLVFGENYPHFHVLVVPRDATVPAERRGGDILKLRPERADRDAARALVPALRAAYADASSAAGHA